VEVNKLFKSDKAINGAEWRHKQVVES